ncbi:transposase [Nonomuraea sp. NPDC049480]|uniref:transposase n=1 Tax=Nonomuraea sp. NPDC049480 TaxID=3364353 RepID=UPI0037A01EE0
MLPAQPGAVAVLGIDEVRRGRPRWVLDDSTGTWTTAVDRRHTGFVDLSGDQGLLGQVEGRTIAAVTGWLNQRDATWREQVAFVAIDMCTIFKAAVRAALPQARLVVEGRGGDCCRRRLSSVTSSRRRGPEGRLAVARPSS